MGSGSRWTPSIRTVLLLVALIILLMPLGGVVLLRLYESVQVRRAESELIAQGVVLVELYRQELMEQLDNPETYGIPARREAWPRDRTPAHPFDPLEASLDLARNPVLPDAPPALEPKEPAEETARRVGKRLTPLLQEVQHITLAGIRVLDYRGTVVATTRGEEGLSLAHREEIQIALEGTPMQLMRTRVRDEPSPPLDSISRSTQIRVFVALPVTHEDRVWGVVVLSRTPKSVLQSLHGIRGYLIGGAGVLFLLVILVVRFTSSTIAKPLEELIRRTERVGKGETETVQPLEKPGTLEVRRLSEAFSEMALSLQQRGEYISTFATNVSHEFKTPLTSMRGAIELLADHMDEMEPADRARFLQNLQKDTLRLERLVNRLHDLARADVLTPGEEQSSVQEVLQQLVPIWREQGVNLQVNQPDTPDLVVTIASETLDTLLSNLVENARQHGGREIEIDVDGSISQTSVSVTVSDNGMGISSANLTKVFDRFFTTARGEGRSGLGLAIVKAILDAHGGSISARSLPGRTSFQISLPRSVR